MNVWLLTTGSSDVQLTSDENWSDWWQEIKKSLYRIQFEPVRVIDDEGEPYRLPARVLGIAHDRLPDQVQPYLLFPLLQNFMQKLETEKIQIDQVIVLISDQEDIFPESERETKRCPYWQDTYQLYPILEDYLSKHFPDATVKPLILKPSSPKLGLDNWDAVLELVQREIADLKFETEPQNVYVSHQAGTPAISSAVQFCCLAKFGDRVKFLVSNEYNPTFPEKPLEGSSYLRGIRIQEAKALLDSHNYAAVEALIGDYIQKNEDIKTLLDAAKNWNVAKFSYFRDCLKHYPKFASEVADRGDKNWWWIGYEEAYLAVIREKQDNIVEAFFHSFRAFEYIFMAWSDREFGGENGHIEKDKGKSYLKKSVLSESKNYFAKAKFKQNGDPSNDLAKLRCRINDEGRVLLDLSTIHKLFRSYRDEYKSDCQEIEVFWDQNNNKENNVSEKRNIVIHQVRGMSNDDLQACWTAREESNAFKGKSWEEKLPIFLNFIVREDFPEGFASLESASLMAKVHQELVEAIANL